MESNPEGDYEPPLHEQFVDGIWLNPISSEILCDKNLLLPMNVQSGFKCMEPVDSTFFVSGSKQIKQMREFGLRDTLLAITVAQFGNTDGNGTLEDTMELNTGELKEESGYEEAPGFVQKEYHTYSFQDKPITNDFGLAKGILSEVFDHLAGDAKSLAGLMPRHVQQTPQPYYTAEFKRFYFVGASTCQNTN